MGTQVRLRFSGEAIVIRVLVGRPYWTIESIEAACPLTIEGLYGHLDPVRGIDRLDALRNAIRMVDALLSKARGKYDLLLVGWQ